MISAVVVPALLALSMLCGGRTGTGAATVRFTGGATVRLTLAATVRFTLAADTVRFGRGQAWQVYRASQFQRASQVHRASRFHRASRVHRASQSRQAAPFPDTSLLRWAGSLATHHVPPKGETDDWLASDKLRHFLSAFAVAGYAHAGLRALDVDGDRAAIGGFAASIAAGIAKEVHDVRVGTFFSLKDLAWDLAGALAGAALVSAAR